MNVFEHRSYKTAFNDLFKQTKRKKVELAEYLNCNPAFISQALASDRANFTAEHVFKTGQFFELSAKEIDFILLLLQYKRAGSFDLREHLDQRITKLSSREDNLSARINEKKEVLTEEEQAIYYSHWGYMALHMACLLYTSPSPRDRTRSRMPSSA